MKKILLTILITSILLCSFTVFGYAAEESTLNIDSFDINVYNNDTYESLEYTFVDGVFDGESMRAYTIVSTVNKALLASKSLNLSSEHEYNLSFKYACTNLKYTTLMVMLSYYSSNGTLIKTDVIDTVFRPDSGNNSFNIDFKPNLDGVSGGYNIKLEIGFLTTSSNIGYFRISDNISLIDKDDDSGFFEEIINSIKEIPNNIKTFFTDLGNTILEGLQFLFIPEEGYFSNLIDELFEFFEDKFGMFALPITLTLKLLEYFNDLDSGTGIISMLPFDIFGIDFFNIDEINLKELIFIATNAIKEKTGLDLYEFYLIFVDCLVLLGFARLVKKKYNSMFDTGSFDEVIEIYNKKRGVGE